MVKSFNDVESTDIRKLSTTIYIQTRIGIINCVGNQDGFEQRELNRLVEKKFLFMLSSIEFKAKLKERVSYLFETCEQKIIFRFS